MEGEKKGLRLPSRKTVVQIVVAVILIIVISYILIKAIQYYPVSLDTHHAHIVIVGGGSTGCILARRLADKYPHKKIVLLERGVNRRNDPNVYNLKNMFIAGFTEPYSEALPTGFDGVTAAVAKMYGGGSSHDFGLAVRGTPDFYNGKWKDQLGLSYSDMLHYFAMIEAYHPEFSTGDVAKAAVSSTRFTSGRMQITPLPTQLVLGPRIWPALSIGLTQGFGILGKALNVSTNSGPLRASDTFSNAVTSAIKETRGVPVEVDYNKDVEACASPEPQLFIDSIVGIRQSTDVKYLESSFIHIDGSSRGKNGNLQLVPQATVTRIEEKCVHWTDAAGNKHKTHIHDSGKIVVSAGGIYSPYLLMKSGYTANGIGQTIKSHYGFNVVLALEPNPNGSMLTPDGDNLTFSSGPLAFVPRTPGGKQRDWQVIVEGGFPQALVDTAGGIPDKKANTRVLSMLLWNLRPRTNGTVSVEPAATAPNLNLHLFEDGDHTDPESDSASLIDALRWLRDGFVPTLAKKYPTLRFVYPPKDVLARDDPTELLKYIKGAVSLTDHYSVGCALGRVVDPKTFKLYESEHVHVVDASVFPEISNGNTRYPVMVMAEVAADRL